MTGFGLAAMPDGPFTKAVLMSVPPFASFRPLGRVPNAAGLAAKLPRQLARFWYLGYFQLPLLPERSASWVPRRLWRRWSPGYDATEDLRHVDAAIGTRESWQAALGPYRAPVRNRRQPAAYAELGRHSLSPPVLPTLYLHGNDDRCMTADFSPWVKHILPTGSEVHRVDNAGHFLQLEQPEIVAGHIVDFVGRG
jgi:pimeloyl-ACP methyl ester carboxylesterase